MCVLIFSTKFVWNISRYKKNWARYDNKCTQVFMYSTGSACYSLVTYEFSRQILEKFSNIKFHENPSSRSPIVSRGPTDNDEANSRISQFCERSQKPTSLWFKGNYFFKFETCFLINHNFVGSLCDVAARHDTWHSLHQRTPPSINCANWQAVSTHRCVA